MAHYSKYRTYSSQLSIVPLEVHNRIQGLSVQDTRMKRVFVGNSELTFAHLGLRSLDLYSNLRTSSNSFGRTSLLKVSTMLQPTFLPPAHQFCLNEAIALLEQLLFRKNCFLETKRRDLHGFKGEWAGVGTSHMAADSVYISCCAHKKLRRLAYIAGLLICMAE